jgi:hypothetical protein
MQHYNVNLLTHVILLELNNLIQIKVCFVGCENILFLGHESPAEDSQIVHGICVDVPYTSSKCYRSDFCN